MTSEAVSSMVSLQNEALIHGPLFLFLLCPLLIVLGAALPPLKGWPFRLAALLALALATASLFLLAPTPAHTDPAVMKSPAGDAVTWIYQSLVVEARIIFVGLTALYIGVILLPEMLRRRDNRLFSTVLPLSFLLLYSAGAVFLVQTTNSAAGVTWKIGVQLNDDAKTGGSTAPARTPD